MRDYTTNNYCDFLWISDLLELKRGTKNEFTYEVKDCKRAVKCTIANVIIFGTIVEVKEVRSKEFLYQVDDGTGVIACKCNEELFEELISAIEQEQVDILSQTADVQQTLEESYVTDTSVDDSVFNDRSIQIEDINLNKKSKLRGLQSLWDDIYKSFNSIIQPYEIGDSVIIHGKLYTYFNKNQIYINTIRLMDIAEEIMLLTVKLEDGYESSVETETSKMKENSEKRLSEVATFDNIPHLHPKTISIPRIEAPELNNDVLNNTPIIVTPNLEPTITFDTFLRFYLFYLAPAKNSCIVL